MRCVVRLVVVYQPSPSEFQSAFTRHVSGSHSPVHPNLPTGLVEQVVITLPELVHDRTSDVSASIGTALGAVSGYYRGWVDTIVSRFADLLMAFPFLIFAIGMMAFLGPGFTNLLLALTLKSWVVFFRLARGAVMAEKTHEYVEAAKVVGQSNPVIIISEILPNIFHSILVLATLNMGSLIITEASLSFLGLGIQPPTPAWGSMIADGRDYLVTSWWIATLPGLAILVLVLSINLFGEGLRDILDPRLKVE